MNTKKLLIIVAILIASLQLPVSPVHAQQVNLSLDPPIVQAKMKPGRSIVVAYTVSNGGDPTNLRFLIRPFTPTGQLGSLSVSQKLEGPVLFSLENTDITIEKPFFFASKEKRQAVLRISIPPGVPDGDYYYLLLAETVPAFSLAGQSTGVASASIGSPLLISITESGVTVINATIAEFSFKPDYVLTIGNNIVRIIDNINKLPIVCSVRNMGKSLIQPQGSIRDVNGLTENKYDIVPQNVLSNSQRVIKAFSDENNTPIESTLVLKNLSLGTHQVTTEIIFAEGTPKQTKTISFLVLPVRLMIILVIVLILLILFLAQKKWMKNEEM